MQREHVQTTLLYRRLIHEMAAFFDCEPNEDAVLEARRGCGGDALIGDLLRAARIEALLIDQGYPPQDQVVPDAELGRLAGCRIFPMLRVEVLMQELIAAHDTLDAVVEALQATLVDVRARGYVALKSIAAYRTGLDIRTWPRQEAHAAFGEARRTAVETGTLRLAHKPLLDTLLHIVFREAARQDMPIQFHVGYGDADADMLLANPLRLRGVLEERAYRSMPVVLLHECYPYTREGAYLIHDRLLHHRDTEARRGRRRRRYSSSRQRRRLCPVPCAPSLARSSMPTTPSGSASSPGYRGD